MHRLKFSLRNLSNEISGPRWYDPQPVRRVRQLYFQKEAHLLIVKFYLLPKVPSICGFGNSTVGVEILEGRHEEARDVHSDTSAGFSLLIYMCGEVEQFSSDEIAVVNRLEKWRRFQDMIWPRGLSASVLRVPRLWPWPHFPGFGGHLQ